MKNFFLLLFFSFFLSCSESDKLSESALIGTWELVQIEDKLHNETFVASDNSEKFVIIFEESEFEGSTGRNQFFGDYKATTKNLSFSEFGISEVAESEIGNEFNKALGTMYDADSDEYSMIYSIENDILELRTSESKIIFKRQ